MSVTDISYKGELQTLTKLSMRHQVCPGETYCTTISQPLTRCHLSCQATFSLQNSQPDRMSNIVFSKLTFWKITSNFQQIVNRDTPPGITPLPS